VNAERQLAGKSCSKRWVGPIPTTLSLNSYRQKWFNEEDEMKRTLFGIALPLFLLALFAVPASAKITGSYVEVRSAEVYTGPCYANSQVGLEGKQAILAWQVRNGAWNGVSLNGLSVVAVVDAKDTLGAPDHNPYPAKAVLIVDQRANAAQRQALVEFAQSAAGRLVTHVVRVYRAPILIQNKSQMGVASVKAGALAKIETRSLCMGDNLCGNESLYYPPLTKVHAMPAYTLKAEYDGQGLGMVWNLMGERSAYVGTFSL
jgi:hypothetical protein